MSTRYIWKKYDITYVLSDAYSVSYKGTTESSAPTRASAYTINSTAGKFEASGNTRVMTSENYSDSYGCVGNYDYLVSADKKRLYYVGDYSWNTVYKEYLSWNWNSKTLTLGDWYDVTNVSYPDVTGFERYTLEQSKGSSTKGLATAASITTYPTDGAW